MFPFSVAFLLSTSLLIRNHAKSRNKTFLTQKILHARWKNTCCAAETIYGVGTLILIFDRKKWLPLLAWCGFFKAPKLSKRLAFQITITKHGKTLHAVHRFACLDSGVIWFLSALSRKSHALHWQIQRERERTLQSQTHVHPFAGEQWLWTQRCLSLLLATSSWQVWWSCRNRCLRRCRD